MRDTIKMLRWKTSSRRKGKSNENFYKIDLAPVEDKMRKHREMCDEDQ